MSREDVREAKRAFIVGAGKAGVAMGEAAMEIVGEKFAGGVISVPETLRVFKTLRVLRGGHPKPNEGSIEAGKAIAELLKDTKEDDVVIAVISGGGSALMELPVEGMTLDDLRELTDHLLKSGAPIQEFNCVRNIFADQRRRAGADGESGESDLIDSLRCDRRSVGCDRFGSDGGDRRRLRMPEKFCEDEMRRKNLNQCCMRR